jgi:hypothetical protein
MKIVPIKKIFIRGFEESALEITLSINEDESLATSFMFSMSSHGEDKKLLTVMTKSELRELRDHLNEWILNVYEYNNL